MNIKNRKNKTIMFKNYRAVATSNVKLFLKTIGEVQDNLIIYS